MCDLCIQQTKNEELTVKRRKSREERGRENFELIHSEDEQKQQQEELQENGRKNRRGAELLSKSTLIRTTTFVKILILRMREMLGCKRRGRSLK